MHVCVCVCAHTLLEDEVEGFQSEHRGTVCNGNIYRERDYFVLRGLLTSAKQMGVRQWITFSKAWKQTEAAK